MFSNDAGPMSRFFVIVCIFMGFYFKFLTPSIKAMTSFLDTLRNRP
jgi:hypothetical protein